MRGAGTPQGVRHEILSVGPSCADNTLHKPEVLIIAVIGGITEARNIQRWPLTTPSRGRWSATCALRRSSLPDVRAPPHAAPRTLEASRPFPTAGTPRARPMRRP
jgi:hypothetical protein